MLFSLLVSAHFAAVVPAAAQQSPVVRNISGLSIGTLLRMEQLAVAFSSTRAAVFVLEGTSGHDVQITVSATRLEQEDRTSGRSEMGFTLLPELCAYSTDEGATWTPFTTTIAQTIPLPARPSATACTVYLRIGGSVTASDDQHRGSYSGTIILTAVYK